MNCVVTVYKTLILLQFVTDTLTIYTPYGELKIDIGMGHLEHEKRLEHLQRDRKWSLMTPDEKIASLRSIEKQTLRVIAGMEDKSNKYPYVVALGGKAEEVSWIYYFLFKNTAYEPFVRTCTGSLISEQWVLTAAHCSFAKLTMIRYGNLTVLPNDTLATYSNVLKVLIQPTFNPHIARIKNDIGLLLVDRVRLNLYGRVSAVDYRTLVGLPVKYIGLGSSNTSILKDQVRNRQYGEAAVATCPWIVKISKLYPMVCLIQRCANLVQVPYSGDSGGPLLQGGGIVGVLTGDVTHPSLLRTTAMYTAVSPFLDWIRTTMHATEN